MGKKYRFFWNSPLKVFGTGNVEEITRGARKMEESFAAIKKKIEDRQAIVSRKAEDLKSEVEKMKNEKASMGNSIDCKKDEVKRKSVELKRLKEVTEHASIKHRLAYFIGPFRCPSSSIYLPLSVRQLVSQVLLSIVT